MLTRTTNTSNPAPEQLIHAPYQQLLELEHEQIMLFVKQYTKQFNLPVVFCWLVNILMFGWVAGNLFVEGKFSILERLSYFSLGMLVFLVVLLPVHELLHAAVYKLQGATRVIIEAQWRKMVFLAIADKFVVNARQFYLVALTPFMVISTVLLLLLPMAGEAMQWVIYGALLFHTSGCTGDFALCSFMWQYRDRQLYTYDDYALKKSYFFSLSSS